MAGQSDTNAAIWKSEEVARSFAAQAGQRERERGEQLTLLARLLPFGPNDAFTFLDLGAGTGAAARAVLAEYPRATAILADFSLQMMAEGENQMAQYSGRYRYVEFDMLSSEWPAGVPTPLDAIVSALSIHHLPDARKQTIFREIRSHLVPSGWYLNYDPIRAPDRRDRGELGTGERPLRSAGAVQTRPSHPAGAGALREPRPLHAAARAAAAAGSARPASSTSTSSGSASTGSSTAAVTPARCDCGSATGPW